MVFSIPRGSAILLPCFLSCERKPAAKVPGKVSKCVSRATKKKEETTEDAMCVWRYLFGNKLCVRARPLAKEL